MLHHSQIGDQYNDDFEGSNEEKNIFTKVFFENDNCSTIRRNFAMGITNFESEENVQTDSSCGSNMEILSTGLIFTKDICDHDPCDNVCPHQGNSLSVLTPTKRDMTEIDDHSVISKRRKSLVEPIPVIKYGTCESLKNRGPPDTSFSTPQRAFRNTSFHLVESTKKGLTFGLYILKNSDLNDGCADNGCSSKLPVLIGNDNCDVVLNKSLVLGVLDSCEIPKHLANSPHCNSHHKSESYICTEKEPRDYFSTKLDWKSVAPMKDYFSDPLYHLHCNVICLLREAGWRINMHRVKNSSSMGSVYISPDGSSIDDFSIAWNMCGQSLLRDGCDLIQEDICMNWNNLQEFLSDLSDTMIGIENKTDDSNFSSLVYRWSLLNPFAFVVLVEKNLCSLKKGKTVHSACFRIVKNYRSSAVMSSKNIADLPIHSNQPHLMCDSKIIQTDSESKGKKISEGSHMEASVHTKGQASDIVQGNCSHIVQENTHCTMQHPEKDLGSSVTCDIHSESMVSVSNITSGTTSLPCLLSDLSSTQSLCLHDIPAMMGDVNLVFDVSGDALTNQESLASSPDCNGGKSGDEKMQFMDDGDMPVHNYERNSTGPDKLGLLFCATNGESYNKILCESNKTNVNLNFLHCGDGSEKFAFTDHDEKGSSEQSCDDNTNDIFFCTNNRPLGSKGSKEPDKSGKSLLKDGNSTHEVDDDDFLISALVKKKPFSSKKNHFHSESKVVKSKGRGKVKNRRGSYKLLPRSEKSGKPLSDVKWFLVGLRSMLSWLVYSGLVSLNDVIQHRNPVDNSVIKCGSVVKHGILCKCCNDVFSLVSFKRHAGCKVNEHCLNLFLESGRPLAICQLEAWSIECRARNGVSQMVDASDQNDDTCGFCGDGGELICCDNCPSTFHQACLFVEVLPEGSWYCVNCVCKICRVVVTDKEISDFNAVKCLQCEKKYHNKCMKGLEGGLLMGSDFCCITCQEVYSSFRSLIGVINYISSNLTWTLLKCIHGDEKIHSAQRLALKAECNSKLAIALTIMEECFLPMVDSRTAVNILPQLLFNMWSIFPRVNFRGFYTLVLEKDDEVVCVAVIRVHGKIAAEMPLIATCSKHRGQGMCRYLMTIIEQMLISLKVEMFLISAVPVLVDTWVTRFGFKPLDDEEKMILSTINLMVFPDSVRLRKQLVLSDTLCGNGEFGGAPEMKKKPVCGSVESGAHEEEAMAMVEVGRCAPFREK